MKTALLTLLGATAAATSCLAQTQLKPQKPATVQTETVHRGASRTHTRTVVPTERHTRTTWRYHSGPKRPQVPVQGTEPAETPTKVPENVKETGK